MNSNKANEINRSQRRKQNNFKIQQAVNKRLKKDKETFLSHNFEADKSQKVAVTFHRDKLGRVVCAGSSVNPFKRFLDPINTPSHKTSGNHFRSYNNSQNMSVQDMGYYENQTPV